MRNWFLRLAALTIGAILLTSAYYRINSSTVMTQAAQHFLASLTPEQRAKATFKFQDEERLNWHFIPRERKGLPLRDMTPPQRALAHALLSAGLEPARLHQSRHHHEPGGRAAASSWRKPAPRIPSAIPRNITSASSASRPTRAPGDIRVEGHHVSQNFTVVNGKVAGSPSFFGANPAEVREGPRKGLRVLAAEEDLARGSARIARRGAEEGGHRRPPKAYKDILTMASRKAALEGQPSGLSAAKMTKKQFDLLHDAAVETTPATCPNSWRRRAWSKSRRPARTCSSPGPASSSAAARTTTAFRRRRS